MIGRFSSSRKCGVVSIPHVWRVSVNHAKSIVCTILNSSGNVCAVGVRTNGRFVRCIKIELSYFMNCVSTLATRIT